MFKQAKSVYSYLKLHLGTRSILPPLYKGSLQLMTLSRLLHQLQHYHTTCTRDGL